MGRDMLAQDYLLKQLAASLLHPDNEPGNSFWKNVLENSQAMDGKSEPTAQLPAEVAVLILAEFIRQPDLSFEQLAIELARHHRLTLKVTQIEELFTLHGLKKTIRTAAPTP